jgi:hypothetical protein
MYLITLIQLTYLRRRRLGTGPANVATVPRLKVPALEPGDETR